MLSQAHLLPGLVLLGLGLLLRADGAYFDLVELGMEVGIVRKHVRLSNLPAHGLLLQDILALHDPSHIFTHSFNQYTCSNLKIGCVAALHTWQLCMRPYFPETADQFVSNQ